MPKSQKDHIDRVLQVFIAEGCIIDAAKDGERLERELGLDAVEFSLVVDSLMKQGLVDLDPDTWCFVCFTGVSLKVLK